jgi:lysyl-tRNA synthetase class 2
MNLHLVRVERHRLGLRLFVFGRRIHEWHLGLLLLGSAALLGSLDRIGFTVAVVLVSVGIWLIAKDWRDLTRSRRDTAAWRLGMHRRPSPLRPWRQLDDVPTAAAVGVAAVGTIDLVSAVTPNVSWRDHLLLHVEPVAAMQTAHVLAVPVSFGLLVTAYFLFRRRSRAVYVALAFMAFLAVSNLIKGLDIEEAALTIAAATLLWSARSSFHVRHEPTTLRAALWQLPLLAAAVLSASLAVVTIAAPAGTSSSAVVGATLDLLLWQPAPFAFHDELAGTGTAVGLGGLLVVICAAYLVFRPLAAPRDLPDAELRHAAVDLVRTHGADTLSFFKLRMDAHYLFSAQRTAFIGYRVEGRVLLISGDPVGEPDAIDEVIRTAVRFAEERGLKLAAIGVSPAGRAALEQAGLRALYIGDEAIVETEHFTLEGRAIRKVRQSVSRLKNAGYHTAATELGTLDTHPVDRLEQIAQE